jgi:hypothetical protein
MPKYNSIDTIPAKVFFQILKDKNYQALKPKPKEKGLEQVFIGIYDEFFLKSDNPESKEYLRLNVLIPFLEYKMASIKQTLHYIYYTTMTKDMFLDVIKALKDGCGIEINTDVDFKEEILRVLNIEIGIINNDLSEAKMDFEAMTKKSQSKDYDYFQSIGALSNVLPNNSLLKEDMTLAVYVTLEKLANKIIAQQKKK